MTAAATISATSPAQTAIVCPGRRPLMPYKALAWALYREERFIAALIGDRKLIAFNVASRDARNSVALIWIPSVLAYLANRPPLRASSDAIMQDLFPGQQATFPVAYIVNLFTCSREHVKHLIDEGSLQIDLTRPLRRGQGQTRWILRQSLIAFLTKGRIS
jgi:hypothetical protein